MDTESLNTFISLCEYKNYTKTSEVLFVAQSTVTKRIVELEKEVGKQLFTRTKRSVSLTKEGEIFLEYAKRIVSMAKESVSEINFANRYQNKIRIGTTNTIYECYVASKIKELFPPHFQFGFEIDNSTKLIPYLLEFGGISFLPESLAKPYIDEGVLRRIELIDFDTPKISCYRIQKV